jgi:signal transduction histidine kinase
VRRRLVILAAANTLMVVLAFLVPLALLVRTLARDRALNAAELEAQGLAPALSLTDEPEALGTAIEATKAGAEGRLSIILPNGTVVGARTDPKSPNLALARRGEAFSAGAPGGMEVLVPVVLAEGQTAVVRVEVPDDLLSRGVVTAWVIEGVVGAALVAVAVFLADRMARSIVRPAKALADAAGRLGEGDLSVRIEPEGPPEIELAAVAFNRLGSRVGDLLAPERELVADLSHRLRTPLTSLRLNAEGIADPIDRRRITEDADELTKALDNVIRQARRPFRADMGPRADVAVVAQHRLEFWAPLAEEQERPWSIKVDEAVPGTLVAVSEDELEAAFDALLGNIFSHTPEGTAFRVEVAARRDGGTRLIVEDDGPGVDPGLVVRGESRGGSTGLGLDIIRRTAEAPGGQMHIGRSASGGARIELEFPAPT